MCYICVEYSTQILYLDIKVMIYYANVCNKSIGNVLYLMFKFPGAKLHPVILIVKTDGFFGDQY